MENLGKFREELDERVKVGREGGRKEGTNEGQNVTKGRGDKEKG